MLRDRYDSVNLFALFPQLGLTMEPALAQLDRLLDDDQLFANVKARMARRHRYTLCHGRSSTPVEVVLRLLVVKHLYNGSFEETEHFVSDSLVLRQFCRLGWERAPDDTTLIRWARLIGPQTLEQLNERAVELARQHKVTRGRPRKRPNKLRVDTTVVATNIHHPTDSGLLGDGVRVLSRLLRRAKGMLAPERVAALGQAAFRSHTKTVRRLAQQMHRIARRRGEEAVEALKGAYARLIAVARQSVREAQRAGVALQQETARGAQRLWGQFQQFVPLVEQGIQQAFRRVIAGEVMPAQEKRLSVFEPHTQVIPRHKAGKEVEFGRKLWLDEVEGGIVTRWRVLEEGGGQDQPYLAASLHSHIQRFGKAPHLLAGDRGISSRENEQLAREAGVKRIVLPCVGRAGPERRQQEKARWFRWGFRFRAGIEGRISVLRRRFGLDRCLYHGDEGMGRWVGWGILASNLLRIARVQAERQAG